MHVAPAHVLWNVLQGSQGCAVSQHSGGQQRRCSVASASPSAARCSWGSPASASWWRRLAPATPPSGPLSQQRPQLLLQWRHASGATVIAPTAVHLSKRNPVCSQSIADASRMANRKLGAGVYLALQRRRGGRAGGTRSPQAHLRRRRRLQTTAMPAAGCNLSRQLQVGRARSCTMPGCLAQMRAHPPLCLKNMDPSLLRQPSPDLTLRYWEYHGLR